MALQEFRIPIHLEDLELQKEDRFCVQKVVDIKSLGPRGQNSLLDDITQRISLDITALFSNDNFDGLYSFVLALQHLSGHEKGRLVDLLLTVLKAVLDHVHGRGGSRSGGGPRRRKSCRQKDEEDEPAAVTEAESPSSNSPALRNCYKMAVCLLFFAAKRAETAFQIEAKRPSSDQPPGASKGKKKKKTQAKDVGFHWEGDLQLKVVTALLEGAAVLSNPDQGKSLWHLGVPEEELALLFPQLAYKILEFPQNSQVRAKDLKQAVLKLIAEPFHRVPSLSVSVSTALLDAARGYEHLPAVVADLCQMLHEDYDDPRLTPEILREIGRTDLTGTSKDIKPVSNLSALVSELALRLPAQVLAHVSVLLPHFDSEPYPIRSALCSAISSIITSLFNGSSDKRGANDMQTRDSLLDVLTERIRDVNAYVRAAVIKAWSGLVVAHALPLDRVVSVVQISGDRLKDKSSQVRKQAIQLLSCLLEHNPYLGNLDPEPYKEQLEKAQLELKDLCDAADKAEMEKLEKTAADDGMEEEKENIEEEDVMAEENQAEETGLGEEAANNGKESTEDEDVVDESPVEEDLEGTIGNDAVAATEKTEEEIEIQKKTREVEFFVSALAFIKEYEELGLKLKSLLKSRTTTDVTEVIDFFVQAHHFGLPCGYEGVMASLVLIWSGDSKIREVAMNAFSRVFLFESGTQKPLSPIQAGENLVRLVGNATISEITSIEEMIASLIRSEEFKMDSKIFDALWAFISAEARGDHDEFRGSSLQVIAMGAAADPALVDDPVKLKIILQHGLGEYPQKHRDWHMVRSSCLALQKCLGVFEAGEGRGLRVRTQILTAILQRLSQFVQGKWCSNTARDSNTWFSAAEQAIAAIFTLSPRPEVLCSTILKSMAEATFSSDSCPPYCLARFFFVLGHSAMHLLIYLEDMGNRLKKAHQTAPKPKVKDESLSDAEEDMADELGFSAEAEMEHDKKMADIAEEEIVKRNLVNTYMPLLLQVVGDRERFPHQLVRETAVLALTKLMCISKSVCEEYLGLIFTVLERSPEVSVRANIIVSLGDLAFRSPNEVEPYNKYIYARLRDASPIVRSHTLNVLTHLILNDMVKVKGQISEIALCLLDEENKIKDMAKHFFQELSQRSNNPVYNLLPDIIGTLSHSQEVSDEDFRAVLSHLLKYIKKDKHAESLVEKLCQRFAATHEISQKKDVAYCLSQLNVNEKCINKLSELFKCYKDFLHDDEIYSYFLDVAKKAKKFSKPEMKNLVLEWEKVLQRCHSGQENSDDELGPNENGEMETNSEENIENATDLCNDGNHSSANKAITQNKQPQSSEENQPMLL